MVVCYDVVEVSGEGVVVKGGEFLLVGIIGLC